MLKKSIFFVMPVFLIAIFFLDFRGAQSKSSKSGRQVIDKAIRFHGGEHYIRFMVEFRFRDKQYTMVRDRGSFRYVRSFDKDGVRQKAVLSNEGFRQWQNGEVANLTENEARLAGDALNSVVYFALLPFGLNDPAVQSKWLGRSTIKGRVYDKVEVTFKREGGGTDFEDRFVYWFDEENGKMDYLAYHFHVNGGGTRFREANNPRRVNGILFQDYDNYKGPLGRIDIENFDQLFSNGQLEKISEIDLVDVQSSKTPLD